MSNFFFKNCWVRISTKLCGIPLIRYTIKPTHKRVNPSLCTVFLKQSMIPLYRIWSDVCFCSFTLMLSAGKDKNAVITDAMIADMFGRVCDFYLNNGFIISVTISLPASCPTFMSSTLNIVISSPLHNFNIPYYLTIVENAWKVLL